MEAHSVSYTLKGPLPWGVLDQAGEWGTACPMPAYGEEFAENSDDANPLGCDCNCSPSSHVLFSPTATGGQKKPMCHSRVPFTSCWELSEDEIQVWPRFALACISV